MIMKPRPSTWMSAETPRNYFILLTLNGRATDSIILSKTVVDEFGILRRHCAIVFI